MFKMNKTQNNKGSLPLNKGASSQKKGGSSRAQMKDPLALVLSRSEFVKETFKKQRVINIIVSASLAVTVGLTFLVVTEKSKEVFFSVEKDGNYRKLIPLSRPNLSNERINAFVSNAIVDTFNFNYFDAKERLRKSTAAYFTKDGTNNLLSNLKKSKNFNAIFENKLLLSFAPTKSPLVIQEIESDSPYQWRVELQGVLTYRTERTSSSNHVVFTLTVVRTSMIDTVNGIAINAIVMEILK